LHTISGHLTGEHRHCDDLFASAENAANAGDWTECARAFAAFRAAIERHLRVEEEVVFPAFESQTGMTMGPTRVMRMEHEQMRGLLRDLDAARGQCDRGAFLGLAETLLILMQQHNLKEENMLYPMTDRALAARRQDLLEAMRTVAEA
jgi:hemerythrin-like domain-containing protein